MKGTVAEDLRFEMKRFSVKNNGEDDPGNDRAVKKVAEVESDIEYWWLALGICRSWTAMQNPRNTRGTENGNNRTSRANLDVKGTAPDGFISE